MYFFYNSTIVFFLNFVLEIISFSFLIHVFIFFIQAFFLFVMFVRMCIELLLLVLFLFFCFVLIHIVDLYFIVTITSFFYFLFFWYYTRFTLLRGVCMSQVRAEDGRCVNGVDISPFIDNLPFGKSTNNFHTSDASGSTSQATNIMEALEAVGRALC